MRPPGRATFGVSDTNDRTLQEPHLKRMSSNCAAPGNLCCSASPSCTAVLASNSGRGLAARALRLTGFGDEEEE